LSLLGVNFKNRSCVTPKMIQNIQNDTDGDIDMLDGFDELDDEEWKVKIQTAVEQGHVDDADWGGVRTPHMVAK
jgi:hypothetical protein